MIIRGRITELYCPRYGSRGMVPEVLNLGERTVGTEVQQVQLTLFRSTSCIIGMAKSRTVTPTGQAQHRPVGLTPVAITS